MFLYNFHLLNLHFSKLLFLLNVYVCHWVHFPSWFLVWCTFTMRSFSSKAPLYNISTTTEKSKTTDKCRKGNKRLLLRRYLFCCPNLSHLYLVAVQFSDISVWLRTASVEFGYWTELVGQACWRGARWLQTVSRMSWLKMELITRIIIQLEFQVRYVHFYSRITIWPNNVIGFKWNIRKIVWWNIYLKKYLKYF